MDLVLVTPPAGAQPVGAAEACDCTDADACVVAGQRLAVEASQFPGVSVGELPDELTFDHTMGVVTPMGSRTVVLTSPRGKYDLAVQVNSLGQARMCTPAGSRTMSGVAPC